VTATVTIPTLSPYRPVVVGPLVRLGARGDGGYVATTRSVQMTTILVSGGIGYEWSFEEAFLNREGPTPVSLVACDASVSARRFLLSGVRRVLAAPLSPKRARERLANARWNFERARAFRRFFYVPGRTFRRRFLGAVTGGRYLSIGELLDGLPQGTGPHVFVKLDVEGAEYTIVPEIVRRAPSVTGLVIEWHDLDQRWSDFRSCMEALLEHFHVVHLHGNNYRPLIPGTRVPATLEGSFAHKALASGRPVPSGATYPIDGLDWPCNSERPDHPLTF